MCDVREMMKRFGVTNDREFSLELIRKTRVATVPGFSFYSDRTREYGQCRFAFCKKDETLTGVRKLFSENLK